MDEHAGRSTIPGQGATCAWPRANETPLRQTLKRTGSRRRLIVVVLLAVATTSILLEVPVLHHVISTMFAMSPGWLALAGALEVASCASFVVIFRLFFPPVPAGAARELAWTEMGSGALLPGGGVGSIAVGGLLLRRAGMSTAAVVERSSALFFLTSATNVIALAGAGGLLALGVSGGPHDFVHALIPVAGALSAAGIVLLASRMLPARYQARPWIGDLLRGIGGARQALLRPHWRLLGAAGYLGFDIAALWVTFAATGHRLPAAALVLAYLIGYLANLIPVPGSVGVLEGGLAGMLILYGAPVTQAAAAALVYHAIAFWIPGLGGLLAYWRLQCRLRTDTTAGPGSDPPPGSVLTLAQPCRLSRRARGV